MFLTHITNENIHGVKLCNCGLQVNFQNECDSFLMGAIQYNSDQNKPVKKSKLGLWKQVAEQHLTKKYTSPWTHFLSQIFPVGEDSKSENTVKWSYRESNLLDHKQFLV